MLQNCLAGEELPHIYWPEVSEVSSEEDTQEEKQCCFILFVCLFVCLSNALVSSKFTLLDFFFLQRDLGLLNIYFLVPDGTEILSVKGAGETQ